MYSAIRLSFTVVVAETNQLWSGKFSQNTSGCPKRSSCLAKFFHKLHDPPNSFEIGAGVLLSPYVVAAVILPFVTNTKSFSVKLRVSKTPPTSNTSSLAIMSLPTCSTITFLTTVSYSN